MAKRILVYTNHYYPEQFKVNDVVNWLKDEMFDLRVVTGLPNYPSGKIFKGYGIFKNNTSKVGKNLIINRLPLIPRGSGSKLNLFFNYLSYFFSTILFTIYLILFKKKYDIVLVHHTSPFLISIAPIIYKIFKSSKNILWDLDIWPQTLVGMNIISNKLLIKILERLVNRIYNFYDQVLVSSQSLKNILKHRINSQKLIFFPNWADEEIESKKIIENLNISFDSEYLNIMYMGNIGEAQDFYSVIKAIGVIKHLKVRLYVIGDGRYKSKLQKLILDYDLNLNIILIDYQDISYMYSYACNSDFLFMSLKSDEIFSNTLPAKIQTYMCIGKPILAMINGEANSLINNEKIGIAVDSGDYTKLAEEISNIYYEKYDTNKMSLNCKKIYQSEFSSTIRKNQIIDLIKSI